MLELQARWHEIEQPLTRAEIETIWPDMLDDEAWNRIRDRKYADPRAPERKYYAEWVTPELPLDALRY